MGGWFRDHFLTLDQYSRRFPNRNDRIRPLSVGRSSNGECRNGEWRMKFARRAAHSPFPIPAFPIRTTDDLARDLRLFGRGWFDCFRSGNGMMAFPALTWGMLAR